MSRHRRLRGTPAAVIGALLLLTAWMALGQPTATPATAVAPAAIGAPDHSDHSDHGALSSVDGTHAVRAPVLTATRSFEPRLTSIWVLPGLAAGLAALCLLRRLRDGPRQNPRRAVLRGRVARRAPPLVSFA